MAEPLTNEEILARIDEIRDWEVVDGKLHRELQFHDFVAAFGFMTKVALIAEKRNHHPDWSNSWNRVTIDIVNHAEGGISDACFELAAAIERALGG